MSGDIYEKRSTNIVGLAILDGITFKLGGKK